MDEASVVAKLPSAESEDVIADGEHFLVVCDGATDKTGFQYDGRTGGAVAAEIVANVVAGAPGGTELSELVARINSEYEKVLGESLVGHSREDRPTAVFCALDKTEGRILRVGDVSWMSRQRTKHASKVLDEIASAARALLLESLIVEGDPPETFREHDPGRDMIMPLLIHQTTWRNLDTDDQFAYGAIAGEPVPARFMEEWVLESTEAEIVIASDGYPVLSMSLAETEASLRRDLQADPLRIGRYASTKGLVADADSFDDRAYVRASLAA